MSEVENEGWGEAGVAGTVGGVNLNHADKNKFAENAEWKTNIQICCFFIAFFLIVFANRGAGHVMGDEDSAHTATYVPFSVEIFGLIVSGRLIAGILVMAGSFFLCDEFVSGFLDAIEVVKAKGKLTVEQEEEFNQKREEMYVTKIQAFYDSITLQFSEEVRGAFMKLILTKEHLHGNESFFVEAERQLVEICRCVARKMIEAVISADTSSGVYFQVVQFNRRNKTSLEECIRRFDLEAIQAESDIRMGVIMRNWIRAIFTSPSALRAAFPLYRSVRIGAYIVMMFELIKYCVRGSLGT